MGTAAETDGRTERTLATPGRPRGPSRTSAGPARLAAAEVYPHSAWARIARPEAAGWSSRGLDSVRAALDALPSTGFMAVVGGRVLMEHGDVRAVSYLASVRKSIRSMLYDNHVANGTIRLDRTRHVRTGDSTRSRHLAYHMHLSTRDMARVGLPMLREGRWRDRQLVPRDWVRESTRAITPVSEMNPARRREGPFGYGYLWWVWDGPHAAGPYARAYTGLGAVGQHITVLPALDLVVVDKTRPGQGRSVSHPECLRVLDRLVRARCAAAGC